MRGSRKRACSVHETPLLAGFVPFGARCAASASPTARWDPNSGHEDAPVTESTKSSLHE